MPFQKKTYEYIPDPIKVDFHDWFHGSFMDKYLRTFKKDTKSKKIEELKEVNEGLLEYIEEFGDGVEVWRKWFDKKLKLQEIKRKLRKEA